MAAAFAELGDVRICYETFGDPADPPLLLIMGLGCQMIEWQDGLCELFVAEGSRVVRFDNRDAGLSTFFPEPVDIFAVFQAISNGTDPGVPYLLSDMAGDVLGLLDHLGIDQAHLVGVSLGGMIAQTLAIEHPGRVASLTSIMSTPGPEVSPPAPEALDALLAPPPGTREAMQERRVTNAAAWGSPGLYSEAELRDMAGRLWDRHYDPAGSARQFAAILASGNRTEQLRQLDVPTLVIHGTEDKLIPPIGGEATAAAVPDAKLVIIEGMGHDLPRSLWPQLVESVTAHTRR